MEEWMERMAAELGEAPLDRDEVGSVLRLARDVAHGAERRLAPLSTYLAGVHAGRRLGEGTTRAESLAAAVRVVRDLLPPAETAVREEA